TALCPLSLHDALPISADGSSEAPGAPEAGAPADHLDRSDATYAADVAGATAPEPTEASAPPRAAQDAPDASVAPERPAGGGELRSEEHTSELQSREKI